MLAGSLLLLLGTAVGAWTWLGYPLLLRVLARGASPEQSQPASGAGLPSASIIIPVHNAAVALESKLGAMDFLASWRTPIEILISLDGCTDASEEKAREAAARGLPVRVVTAGERGGKSGAQNRAAESSQGEVLVLTDVDTSFGPESLRALLAPFADARVGYVAGNLDWREPQAATARSGAEYTGWERALWAVESRLGVLHVASGAFMAVRRKLYEPLSDDVGDDAMIPLDVVGKGHRGVFAPSAHAVDDFSHTLGQEFRGRVRMTSRSFRATLRGIRRGRLWRRPGLFLAVVTHRLLRWTTPFWLLAVAAGACSVTQAWIRQGGSSLVVAGVLGGGALAVSVVPGVRRAIGPFLVVNAAFLVGVFRSFTRRGAGAYRTGQGR